MKYININGSYGFGQNYALSYSSASGILAEMDRLGIGQTVLEFPTNSNARQRNETLLKDIAALSPENAARVIPCFVLDAACLYEDGALDAIVSMAETHRPCCFSAYPKNNKYRFRALEPVLARISHLDPIVLIDKGQLNRQTDMDDLIAVARKNPNMSFVLRRFIYNGMPDAFDAMRQAENICIDNSLLHTREGIKLTTSFFGENRLLFGLSYKGNCGASMASITYADIPEVQKDMIRYGNFIRLFKDEKDRRILTEGLRELKPHVKNSFWEPFVNGCGCIGTEIIDIHTHMGSTGSNWYLYQMDFPRQIENFEKDMKRYGIRRIVTSVSGRADLIQANIDMEEAVKGREDRFKGYVRYNPNFDSEFSDEYLDARLNGPYFIGLKTLPQYMGINIKDPRYDRMFRYADNHKLPILIHCWDGSLGNPGDCAEAASRWPGAQVILGHSGGSAAGRKVCEQLAQDHRYDNLWFEFCGSFTEDRSWEDTLKYIDYHRVLYGTDACLHEISFELGRLLSADIPDEQLKAVLGGNARRLLHMDEA